MGERLLELQAILAEVRRRWTQRAVLRSWMIAAAAAATVLLAGLGAVLLVAREGFPLVLTVALVTFAALFALARAFWPLRHRPTDRQLARFIEEKSGGLDDVLVTAVDYSARPDAAEDMREWLAADAVRATHQVPVDTIVSRASIRTNLWKAVAATAALALVAIVFAIPFERATALATAYLFPARIAIDVNPGNAKVRGDRPVMIVARITGLEGGFTPMLTIKSGGETQELRMQQMPAEGNLFFAEIDRVTASFSYNVSVAGRRSDDFDITVIHPARVQRIDISYDFPSGLGLEPRVDEESGDIYGPAGTKVKLTITTDKPIARAALTLDGGGKVDLRARDQVLEGELTIEDDGSYRVALNDVDGLENPGDTEYFIRTLDDRPPDVRILRPAGDKQVTALEEVQIEARADDDYGIASFDLVFQAPGGKERVVPLRGANGGLTANGLHTMFMEELGVQPGDFVTYFARARDVSRGRRSTEARSDIFFLEVKPFEEEFVAAQSQAMMGGGGGGDRGLQGLAEAQKEIIIATWKLDARGRRARDAKSSADVKAVAKAQSDLKQRAETASAQFSRTGRRRTPGGAAPGNDPIGKAIEAMGRAVVELDKVSTSNALPHEMEALNQLLKADAENRRRQVARQQQAGGGGGMNRSEADLSSLFDQELRKRNQTNYETPNTTEERQETKQEDPLEKIRELARRQDALNRQQRDLARNRTQIEQEELKRQLERLQREQNQLRQEAEQLARQMGAQRQQQSSSSQQQQQQSSSSQSSNQQSSGQGQGQQGPQGSRQLREISEEMRNAATDMNRQNAEQAMARGERASERLRDLEKQLQASSPDDRKRALGDLQLETRQLADAQRRLANEASKTGQGQSGQDARRRLAGEQDRLADRTDRLQDNVKRLAKSGQGSADERRAIEDAARELDRQQVTGRMRQSAEALRQNSGAQQQQGQPQGGQPQGGQSQGAQSQQASRQGEAAARALDQIAERLGAASGAKDADSRKLSDQLAKAQELREQIAGIEKNIEKLQRENAQQPGQQPGEQSGNKRGQQGQQGQQSGQQGGQQTGQPGGEGGGNGSVQQLQREVNERMREANRLADEMRRENPGMQGAKTPEEWWRSFSAPGTEAFKQDFARWESLKKNLLVALEHVESQVSEQLRTRENKERLNAGGHTAVSESYRELVERYYRSLAAPRKP